jgi:HEAT repeat protein
MTTKKTRKNVVNSALTLILVLILLTASTIIVSAQTETINDKKNAAAKEGKPAAEDKNKPVVVDPKKADSDTAKKEVKPEKASNKPEVWDDAKKAEKIESTLEYGMQKERKIAIIMINDIKDEQIKNKLIEKLINIIGNDSDIEVRKAAVTAIGDHKSETAAPALIKALDDEEEDVKIAACYALGRIKAESAKTKLIELLQKQDLKKDSNLTDAIITTLYEIKSPDILELAVTSAKDNETSRMIRERLIIYIGNTGSAAQKDFLIELFKNDEEEAGIRSYAIKSIAKLKLKEATPEIKEIIKEIDSYSFAKKKKYYDIYMQAVAALVEMGDTDSIDLLMNSLRSDNTAVRLKAVNLIKEFNDERTIDILKYKMKNDPNARIRKTARKALEDKGLIEKGKEDENQKNDFEKDDKDE